MKLMYHVFLCLGEEIQRLSDWQSDRCYGTRCNKYGEIIAWENFNCYSTPYYSTTTDDSIQTTPSYSTPSQTDDITTDSRPGCFDDSSAIYQPGEEISYQYFSVNRTCCGKYCNYNNKIVEWQKFECDSVSMELHKSTVEPTTDAEEGCNVDGKIHKPQANIDCGNDGERWCFGRYCSEHSRIVFWDDFNCDVTKTVSYSLPTSSPIDKTTTNTPTTVETTSTQLSTTDSWTISTSEDTTQTSTTSSGVDSSTTEEWSSTSESTNDFTDEKENDSKSLIEKFFESFQF